MRSKGIFPLGLFEHFTAVVVVTGRVIGLTC